MELNYMKKYLINPNQKQYKANLHCHTNFSDGYFSPEEIKRLYMEHDENVMNMIRAFYAGEPLGTGL